MAVWLCQRLRDGSGWRRTAGILPAGRLVFVVATGVAAGSAHSVYWMLNIYEPAGGVGFCPFRSDVPPRGLSRPARHRSRPAVPGTPRVLG